MKYCVALLLLLFAFCTAYSQNTLDTKQPIHVLVWSDDNEPEKVYPAGLAQTIANDLNLNPNIKASTANIDDPEQGLNTETLQNTDVLIWFAHSRHDEISDTTAAIIAQQVKGRGMGFIALHSAHFSKPFKAIMQTSANWSVSKDRGEPETLFVVNPQHPIAQGVSNFYIPHSEQYTEPFDVPKPDDVVMEGVWPSGAVNREVMTWTMGSGRIVYITAGHEDYPIYSLPEMQKVLANAVIWSAHQS